MPLIFPLLGYRFEVYFPCLAGCIWLWAIGFFYLCSLLKGIIFPHSSCVWFQSFTNEDHLNVHRKKHQMSLSLGAGGNKLTPFISFAGKLCIVSYVYFITLKLNYCTTGLFYWHLIFAVFTLPMIVPKWHPSNKHPDLYLLLV